MADYLDLLLPPSTRSVIPELSRGRIEVLARDMPPVPRIAVECRLASGDEQIDIQQCFLREGLDFRTLQNFASALAMRFPGERWPAGVLAFATQLAGNDVTAGLGDIDEVFLEFDLPAAVKIPNAPAVFFSLPRNLARASATALEALRLLRGDISPDVLSLPMSCCFAACDGDEIVAYIGTMLSRDVDALRINVKGLRPERLEAFLRDCSWTGDPARAVHLLDESVLACDRVTKALDVVGPHLLPRIGVECFFDEPPALDQRWRLFLQTLVDQGVCDPAKVEPFLAIPSETTPPDVARCWPLEALRTALLKPETEFTSFARRAVHIKVTEKRGEAREAKAYFGAGHLWLTPSTKGHAQPWLPTFAKPPSKPHRHDHRSATVDDRMIGAAVEFLLGNQQQSDLWRDFRIGDAIGDEWVSAFVATQLAATKNVDAVKAAERSWQRLQRCQRSNGGWGYSRDYPPDADSTAWALRLAEILGHHADEPFRRGRTFLELHVGDDGGVTTYSEQEALARRIGLSRDASFAGWRQPHACVTAAAAPFLTDRSRSFLRDAQFEGRWRGYWWPHDAYATALALEALANSPSENDHVRIAAGAERAIGWLATRDDRGGATAFDVAFCIRILRTNSNAYAAEIKAAIDWLGGKQNQDGSWMSGARLRVPQPGVEDADAGAGRVAIDHRRNFTTAAVVSALSVAQSCGSDL